MMKKSQYLYLVTLLPFLLFGQLESRLFGGEEVSSLAGREYMVTIGLISESNSSILGNKIDIIPSGAELNITAPAGLGEELNISSVSGDLEIGTIRPQTGLKNYSTVCGAALIDKYHAITASHCVEDFANTTPFNLFVLNSPTVSQSSRGKAPTPESRIAGNILAQQAVKVARMIVPVEWMREKRSGGAYDITVLKLESPIEVPHYISLPEDGFTQKLLEKKATVELTGFGIIDQPDDQIDATRPTQLRKVELDLFTTDECLQAMSNRGGDDEQATVLPTTEITDEQRADFVNDNNAPQKICAGGAYGGTPDKGACHGDSGGPLVYKTGGKSILVGIVHAGTHDKCVIKGTGMYTTVEYYKDFIKQAISGEYNSYGRLTKGDIDALPKGFSMVGSSFPIEKDTDIFENAKTILIFNLKSQKWQSFTIVNGKLPEDFDFIPKSGFWINK